jgi:uncharacterized protein YerC
MLIIYVVYANLLTVANTKNHAYLSDQEVLNLTIGLCETLSNTSTLEDIASILLKLLSPQELRMLIIRLRVQKMLLENVSYEAIKKELHVSSGTISRAKLLLEQNGIRPTRQKKADDALAFRHDQDYQGHTPRKVRKITTPMTKYSANAWPIEFIGAFIDALQKKTKPP